MEHELARELNGVLEDTAPGALLSAAGRRLYFPKGIIAQSAEAKQASTLADGTLGIAVKQKTPLILRALADQIPGMSAGEIVSYAPTAGIPALRETWAAELKRKNPSLKGIAFSLPVVTSGLTGGISALCDLFLDEGLTLLAANPSWDNYALIAEGRRNARLRLVDMFNSRGIDLPALESALTGEARTGFVRIILNFPHNPTGYSPTVKEAGEICRIIRDIAEGGARVLVICDDAYFGLRFEEDIEPQSLFAYLGNIHENVFAVKIDGATKEDFAWGMRCGFVTFAGKNLSAAHYDALTKKIMAVIRSTVSSSSTVVQNLLQKTYAAGGGALEKERAAHRDLIAGRYKKVRALVDAKKNHPCLEPLPFNSGYFMSFTCKTTDAESLRRLLLSRYGVGAIAIDARTLRLAFSGIDDDRIEAVYAAVYRAAEELAR
jgi:aspartate/methionine/tyrosine aminotransferase